MGLETSFENSPSPKHKGPAPIPGTGPLLRRGQHSEPLTRRRRVPLRRPLLYSLHLAARHYAIMRTAKCSGGACNTPEHGITT
jgi:hypothetical protein